MKFYKNQAQKHYMNQYHQDKYISHQYLSRIVKKYKL